jgi:hypothetical protein
MRRWVLFLAIIGLLLLVGCKVTVDVLRVTISPGTLAPLPPGTNQVFTASVNSSDPTEFRWTATGGTLSSSTGTSITYTAPDEAGTYTLRAETTGFTSIDDSVEITVDPFLGAEPVNASTNGAAISATTTLSPGASKLYVVSVDQATADAGQALYIEIDKTIELTVFDANRTAFASSTSADFFASGLTGLASFTTQAVPRLVNCRGACVIQDAEAEVHYVKIENSSASTLEVDFFAFVEDYGDSGEDENDTEATALTLTRAAGDSGAIESLGDSDFYKVGESGDLLFISQSSIGLQADVEDTSGEIRTVLPTTDDTTTVIRLVAGDLIRVYIDGNSKAADANSSFYSLTITTP